MSILIVDDDEDDYFLMHAILVDVYGDQIDVDWISSYETAIETLLSNRHGLCLMDYNLGARTGLDLLREVLARGCRTPIIMLTGNSDWEVDVKAMEAGAADYLVKGQFGGRQLERSIRYAIGFAVEKHQTLEALRRSEERYALAVRGAADGLWDWDLTTDRIYYAPRWKSILGFEDGQIGDSILEWFDRLHPLDSERVKAEVSDHLTGKTPHLETEHRMRHRDGSYRWVLTRGLAVRNGQGKAVRMAGSQSDITQRKAAEYRMQHDSLTGLPNRALLMDRLSEAVARTKRAPGYRFGVLFLDIDSFKGVNDSLGHSIGDQLLVAISRRLECCIRDADTIARVGGDEFISLIDSVETEENILSIAGRILESLRAPFLLDGHEVIVSASIGVAMSNASDGTAEEIVKNADSAMYRAKSRGKAGIIAFDEAIEGSDGPGCQSGRVMLPRAPALHGAVGR
ncbi:MAG TPA: diguanylate cyclase, partial [Isosphaeraceae bacterium]|nr:diguanylate cyclase [Isosphaeraceae bacterium]